MFYVLTMNMRARADTHTHTHTPKNLTITTKVNPNALLLYYIYSQLWWNIVIVRQNKPHGHGIGRTQSRPIRLNLHYYTSCLRPDDRNILPCQQLGPLLTGKNQTRHKHPLPITENVQIFVSLNTRWLFTVRAWNILLLMTNSQRNVH